MTLLFLYESQYVVYDFLGIKVMLSAVNIDFYASDFESQLDMLNKDKVYLVYCRSDNRSGQAVDRMEDLGFIEAYDMSGGINAWNDAGYPTVQ